MGMDVYGKSPSGEAGGYFRNNVWAWRPLWDYVCAVAQSVISEELWEVGHSNSGAGLGARGSKKVAKLLRAELASGRTKEYAEAYKKRHDELPDLTCEWCDGTGTRNKPVPSDPTWKPKPGECNGCGGKGKVRPQETWYPFDVENVEEFTAFLEQCGGFEIC